MTSVAARDKNNPPHNHNSMENNSGVFSINTTTGDIFLSTGDREEQEEYLLKVVARDGS